jgi:pyridoxine 4-dehydrogenase
LNDSTAPNIASAGTIELAEDLRLTRMGYGAMQLAGPRVWGPPQDRDAAMAVLHEVVALGLTQLIREALDLVNLRMTGTTAAADIVKPFTVLAELQQEGLIKHLGVSNVSTEQVAAARQIAPIRTVQNFYNLAVRKDDPLVDLCADIGTAFVPFLPLGGFRPLQSEALQQVAAGLGHTPMQVALAWLLHRSPTMLLIPGTSSVRHLRENVAAADITLPQAAVATLNSVGA